jgi:hypothetical protein
VSVTTKLVFPLLAVLSLTSIRGASAASESPGDRLVRLADEAMTRARDEVYEYEATTQEPGKAQTRLTFRVAIKGKERRLVDFLAPGDVKGMRFLVLTINQMYVFLPAFQKVRRVASHARSQSFMGTALSQDDASIVTYGEFLSGKLLSETGTHWKVEATRRPGRDFPYPRLELTVRKDGHLITEIGYFNDKGVRVKTETRADFECQGNVCGPKILRMVDHARGGMWTELKRLNWKVNTGIADSEFTPRALQRAR